MASPISAQTIVNATLASATALTVPGGTRYCDIQAIGGNYNYFTDGSTPTTGVNGNGKKLYDGAELRLVPGLASIKFIREADNADARLVVEYFGGTA